MEIELKRRRRRRYQWRSRSKLYNHSFFTNDDKKSEDKETRRANWLKRRMLQFGQPLAPYNTTQFIMDDHNVREPDFEQIDQLLHTNHNAGENQISRPTRRRCHSDTTPSMKPQTSHDSSSEEFYSSPDDEQDFMQKQFFETYESIHAERISSMSKSELVQEYILLEHRIEELENRIKSLQSEEKSDNSQTKEHLCIEFLNSNTEATLSNFCKLRELVKLLNEEIVRLREENGKLQKIVSENDSEKSTSNISDISPIQCPEINS